MFFMKNPRGNGSTAALLPDLEESVAPLAADEGVLKIRKDGVLHVRTRIRAGLVGGEGTSRTDR